MRFECDGLFLGRTCAIECTLCDTCSAQNLLDVSSPCAQNEALPQTLNPEPFVQNFRESNKMLDMVQKGLADYLETKRLAFSRFFFLSNDELLQILSQSKNPLAVQPHLRKCFEAISDLDFKEDLEITAMNSGEREKVGLHFVSD
jgi:hypothetical protein